MLTATPSRPLRSPIAASRIWDADRAPTVVPREPSPIELEVATAVRAAVDAALAQLRARQPEQCTRCGGRKGFYRYANTPDGWWRCWTCHGGTFRPLPTPAEDAEATAQARAEATDRVLEPGNDRLRRAIAADRHRDRRQPEPLLAAWRTLLLHRAAPGRYGLTRTTREWVDHRLLDLVQKYLEVTGHEDPFSLRAQELAPRALLRGVDGWGAIRALTTSDFPSFLDGVAHTLFVDAYADTVRSFEAWTTAITVADFKSTVAGVAAFPDLLAVPEHAEYVAGSPFGPAVRIRLTCFGRLVQFTRAAVLRDDVASFGQLQQALGVAAANVENDVVYELLVSNPAMADGQPLFSAAHKNVMPAKALDATSLAAACATLATNSNHGRAAVLLVGTTDGPTARTLVTQQTPPDAGDASGVLQVVQDDRITAGWYVTCDPAERPTFVTAHLRGVEGPELFSQDAWAVDAREYKARLEFGAAVVDASSMVYTPHV